MSLSLTTSQRAAIDAATEWYSAPEGSLVFRLFGYARVFREDAARWLYTAVTRAAKHVTVVR